MYLPYLIASINNTTNSFGLSASMVTFGEELLPQGSLLKLDPDYSNTKEYFEQMKPHVDKIRAYYKRRKDQRILSNLLYLNKRKRKKELVVGDVVIIQSLHLTAGRGVRATGSPGIILDICSSKKSALVENLLTGRIVKYNFSYLRRLTKPLFAKLPDNWKREIEKLNRADPRETSSSERDLEGSQVEEPGPLVYSQPLEEIETDPEVSQENTRPVTRSQLRHSQDEQSGMISYLRPQDDTDTIVVTLQESAGADSNHQLAEDMAMERRRESPPFHGFTED